MAPTQPFVLRWGIISTGNIARSFVLDLLVDPKTRDVHDVVHKVTAVGSRSLATADDFVRKYANGDTSIKTYGSYAEVYADEDVDAVYIGTPHTYHYENALDAIKATKHVLCEKPVTSNVAELRSLLAAAKEQGVFFMEALWTRFQPLVKEVKKIAESGILGEPVALQADLSSDFKLQELQKTHRILNPYLGGGALLDLGPYPLIWALLALYEHPSNQKSKPSQITGAMLKTPLTGVDRSTSFTVTFAPISSSTSNTLAAQAVLSCNINAASYQTGVVIRYEGGTIAVRAPIYCPRSFTVQYFEEGKPGSVVKEETRQFEYAGNGWHFQADEVARCVRDGKVESELWGHDKSLLEMEIFDEVRRQGDYKFPPGVEKVV
ncbi:hypothetical protein PISMIDRAFT_100142 [Pisolithus microcarpus 441]|uniref:D-xylose 1-dehydrogenase (NADP(+), D-xylono-1,5-lactone-forming) n=1 Tax=Pisolithus microcarpus 441 TaxID=765257 RepID=A0A0C9ZVE4_9AGAM|nr:hypothetical protein PISMIDRAFT_100142 [Pisolithus microcarpus 441]